jgi:chorismate mutase/prephenate dehydratase
MNTLDSLRNKIDEVDEKIVELLGQRADLALQVKQAKAKDKIDVYSSARERQIIDRVLKLAKDSSFPLSSLEKIFSTMIAATRSLIGDLSIVYSGVELSLAHEAAIKQFGETVKMVPQLSPADVVSRVTDGIANFGVIPAENGTDGLLVKTFEALIEAPLQIVAEVYVDERYSILSKSSNFAEVKRIYGDIRSISHAGKWLRANFPQSEQVLLDNSALGCDKASFESDSAAIVLSSFSDKYQLNSLANNIENEFSVESRYIVIGHTGAVPTGNDKTSILVVMQDKAGALRALLEPFSERGITLLKIESKPMRSRAWEYAFFIDLSGHQSESAIQAAFEEIQKFSTFFKIFGSYPQATTTKISA